MNHADILQGHLCLPNLGVIKAQGADAAHFLHNQTTQDFLLLNEDEARFAGYCSAKGRLLASFVAWRWDSETIFLVCSRDILADTVKRLQMFVLRAKVKITDVSNEMMVIGLAGRKAIESLGPPTPWRKATFGTGQAIWVFPSVGVPRAIGVVPVSGNNLGEPQLSASSWDWGRVHSGVCDIQKPLVDLFVPQMLNYESVGGINFKKGCYPGQEVVARSQFRGTLKRRTFLAHLTVGTEVGAQVFHSSDAEQPCGTILDCAPHPESGFDALVCTQVTAWDNGTVHLMSIDGPRLERLALPYDLETDI